ncbi:MAG TPA: hypothetical protein VGF32_33070 [Streptosporangiaceae bacterium]|jgi:hypothetical protein
MGNALPRALAEVVKHNDAIGKWEADAAAKTAELQDLEARAGAEVLDDESAADRLAGDMLGLRTGIDLAERAAEAARTRLDAARRDVLRARASEVRGEAGRLRKDAAERQQRTDKLCAELADFEGVKFGPALVYDASGIDTTGHAPLTKTQQMVHRAGQLEAQAAKLEQQAEQGSAAEVATASRKAATVPA